MTHGVARIDPLFTYFAIFRHIDQPLSKNQAGTILSSLYANGKANSLNFRCIFSKSLDDKSKKR
jgi:hypothetical protein